MINLYFILFFQILHTNHSTFYSAKHIITSFNFNFLCGSTAFTRWLVDRQCFWPLFRCRKCRGFRGSHILSTPRTSAHGWRLQGSSEGRHICRSVLGPYCRWDKTRAWQEIALAWIPQSSLMGSSLFSVSVPPLLRPPPSGSLQQWCSSWGV